MFQLDGDTVEEKPSLLFDRSDTSCIHSQQYHGLKTYGPYDKSVENIDVAIITPEEKLSQVKNLVQDLKHGKSVFPGGMKKFFRTDLNLVNVVKIENNKLKEYEEGTKRFAKTTDISEVDVVIVRVPHTGRFLRRTPYYRCKAILTSHGFPSQMITEKTFENLKWSYLNIASAIFSKSGGIPWVLEKDLGDVDMILGMSRSNNISKYRRTGDMKKYVGFVNVFDRSGKWMFLEATSEPYKENGDTSLERMINSAVDKFKSEKMRTPKEIEIHYYKKWGKGEIERVNKILRNKIGSGTVNYITVDDSHPFRVYDKTTNDGSFPRGYYANFKYDSILLSTTGETEIAGRRMGTPKLLKIRAERYDIGGKIEKKDSTDEFFHEIAKRTLAMTRLNWSSSTPLEREPVTISFARRIAYLVGVLSEDEWKKINNASINRALRKTPWFL
ncbi:MAG: Piwi domain-containing protein [Thermoplasmatota archaeon]